MRKLKLIVYTAIFALATNVSMAQQTAFDNNNQNRAIGIARAELVDCLQEAYNEGPDSQIEVEARGNTSEDGDWTVAFFDHNRYTYNGTYLEPYLVGYVRMSNWVVYETACFPYRDR